MHVAPTPCLKRRLLFAASQAYHPAMVVHGREVGWVEPPLVIRRALVGSGAVDQALVGRVAEGIVIAVRGSLPPFFAGQADGWTVLADWLNDAAAWCVEEPLYRGGVHLGFADSTARLWDDLPGSPGVRSALEALVARSRRDRRARLHLFLAGHSKGGAVANLMAMRAADAAEWRALPVSVATLGAARAGDARFARAYAATRIACLRYEVAGDLVPHLPPAPETPGFVRAIVAGLVPALADADWQGVGLRIAAGPRHQRWEGSRRRLPRLRGRRGPPLETLMPGLLTAHTICPGSAYDRLVCEGEAECDHGAAQQPLRRIG